MGFPCGSSLGSIAISGRPPKPGATGPGGFGPLGLLRTSDGFGRWGYVPSRRPITAIMRAGYPTVIGLVSPHGAYASGGRCGQRCLRRLAAVSPRGHRAAADRRGTRQRRHGLFCGGVRLSTGDAQTPCPSGHLPLWFRSLWLNVPGGTWPFSLDVSSMAITMIALDLPFRFD